MRALLLAFFIASPAAFAAEWVALPNLDEKKGAIFIDMSSVASTDETLYSSRDMRKAWFKIELKADHPGPKQNGKQLSIRSTLSLHYFDCTERKMAVGGGLLYDAKNKEVGRESITPVLLKFEDVPPETIEEEMLGIVCKVLLARNR